MMSKSPILVKMTAVSIFVLTVLSGCSISMRTAGMPDDYCEGNNGACSVAQHEASQVVRVVDLPGLFRAWVHEHPDEIYSSINDYVSKQASNKATQQSVAAKKAITENHEQIFALGDDPFLGNPNGDVVLVEFFDYQCSQCKAANPTIQALLLSDPNVKIILKEFPLVYPGTGQPFFSPASILAAKVSLAGWQTSRGEFQKFHVSLLADSSEERRLSDSTIFDYAVKAGYSAEALHKAVTDSSPSPLISRNWALADKLGINATPTFVIGDKILTGSLPLTVLQAEIQQLRASSPGGADSKTPAPTS